MSGWNKLRPADTIIVENIGGAGGILGMSTVAKAVPDGRTLLFSPSGNIVISPYLQTNLPYDTPTAFEPLVLVGSVKSALVVRAKPFSAPLGQMRSRRLDRAHRQAMIARPSGRERRSRHAACLRPRVQTEGKALWRRTSDRPSGQPQRPPRLR